MSAKELVEVGASLANFGLKEPAGLVMSQESDEDQVAPEEEVGLEESDDAEEQDASEESDEEESDEDDDSVDDIKSQLAHKEQVIRKFQSKVDSQEAQMSQMQQQLMSMYQEFQQLKNKPEDDEDDDIDDDDIVTGKQLKAMRKTRTDTSAQLDQFRQYVTTQQQQEQQRQLQQQQWLQSQPDMDEVSKFITEHNLSADPEIAQLQTDQIGLYYAVKAKMLEQKTKGLAKATKSAKRRKTVPPTGGKGSGSVRKSNSKTGSMEAAFEKMFRDVGLPFVKS